MKKILTILLLVVTMLSLFACKPGRNNSASSNNKAETATPGPSPTPLPTPVKIFHSNISADGEVVLPLPPQTFSFQTSGLSGTIAEIYTIPGREVKKGELLARIDETDLKTALTKVEASLSLLKAQIKSETATPLKGDVNEARISLETAKIELADLLDKPSENAITQAAADLRLREIDLRQAQEAYDAVAYLANIGLTPQAAKLQQTTLNYERAQAVYNEAVKPATNAQIAGVRLKVAQAQNRLGKLLAGQRPETKAVNKARLTEARLRVEEAKTNLAKAKLFAPWDGIVTAVNAAPGVSTANAYVTIAKVEPLRFATNNFSERNLAEVKVGDKATIFLKTYPDVPIPAVIQQIELASVRKDGDTALFTIYLDFNSADFKTQPGMTGRVEIDIEVAR